MKRFFGSKKGNNIVISGSEHMHLSKVMRLVAGDKIIASLNDDYDYYCTLLSVGKNESLAGIDYSELCPALPKRNITLYMMLPKKEYLDSILAKAVELGVNKIVPFTSEYTMIKDIRRERVETQIMTACKQCERSRLVEVTDPIKFENLPAELANYDLSIFAYENEKERFDPKILDSKQNIAVIVGNEAGFSPAEAQILQKAATSVSLGTRILRCDTAVVATLALVSVLSGN